MVDIMHDISDGFYRAIPTVEVELVSSWANLDDIPAFNLDKIGKLLTYILKLPPTKNWRPILVEFDGQLNSNDNGRNR